MTTKRLGSGATKEPIYKFKEAPQAKFSADNSEYCKRGLFCKRVSCSYCMSIRRAHFVYTGAEYSLQKALDVFVTVTWSERPDFRDPWSPLVCQTREFAKSLSGKKAGPYIRALAVAQNQLQTPHLHQLCQSGSIDKIGRTLQSLGFKYDLNVTEITSWHGILGYMFDANFTPTVDNPERPRRVRFLTGSKGAPVGFPRDKEARLWLK